MAIVLIQVKQKHINEGKRGNALLCPLALAIAADTGRRVLVMPGAFRFAGNLPDYEGYESKYRNLPGTAELFRKRFDHQLTVRPFSFEVEL